MESCSEWEGLSKGLQRPRGRGRVGGDLRSQVEVHVILAGGPHLRHLLRGGLGLGEGEAAEGEAGGPQPAQSERLIPTPFAPW